MPSEPIDLLQAPDTTRRILGKISGTQPGPTMIVMAGLHGNEPAGLRAAERVLARLADAKPTIRGELVAVAGNLRALAERARFIERDLNRIWIREEIARLQAGEPAATVEDVQRQEVLGVLQEIVGEARGEILLLDLHTSSSDGPPFITIGDTLRNRRIARGFPLPLILGLEEQVDGALLEYMNNFGFITMGAEGGQHDDPVSIDQHEAILWLTLEAIGLIEANSLPELERSRAMLAEVSRGAPRVVEVRRRHAISPDDQFVMEPGFSSFDPVRKGQRLGRDKHGPVLAPEDGLVLLPLYQGQGNEGFFISREIRSFWLRVSALLRRVRIGALLRLLPGVRRHRTRAEVLIVDQRIARWYPLEIFHLFGYRKLREQESGFVAIRRNHDLAPPDRHDFCGQPTFQVLPE